VTGAALVPMGQDEVFALAERVSKSNLLPAAYRGKPTDAAVALMLGQEIGLPPMTALNRIVVIEGKPTLDAQGMVAVIRAAGHSLSGDTSSTSATVRGKRADTGDEMSVTFTMEDAARAGLAGKGVWKSYPSAMLWARCVSQLARMLFADVLMGFSYLPEEADFSGKLDFDATGAPIEPPVAVATVERPAAPPATTQRREPPKARPAAPEAVPEPDEAADAEVVANATVALRQPEAIEDAEEVSAEEARVASPAGAPVEVRELPTITQREANALTKALSKTGVIGDEVLPWASAYTARELGSLRELRADEYLAMLGDIEPAS